ncbi:cation:proton antiporter [Filomicrobium sp.]|uniref:cation:proton antiporter domain-containing protein n=1 Tax=Filomicrobium sp. TaxID=2024831 RepID=UPI00258C5557|nr:cation:proton antiporter [Filomicrobium sp.]MCV0369790.1 cation:proton antiporter [Filomicrobium sp.]
MGHEGQEVQLKDALVFLFAAGIVVPVLRLFRVPSVLGFLLAGVALGPHGIGAFVADWPALSYLTISDPRAAAPFAELGILFLLFLLGLELSFEKLWSLRRAVFGAGSVQAALSALVIGGAAFMLGQGAPAAVAVGLALALSSTAIVMQMLSEEHRVAGPVGQTALAVLLFQDMLVAPILILLGFLARGGEANLSTLIFDALLQGALAIVIIFVIGRIVLRRAFRLAAQMGGRDFLMALTLLIVVGAAVLTAGAGLSLALGAFLAGLLLGETEFKHQTEVDLEPFKGLLLGLFFTTVGMGLDLASVWSLLPIVVGGLVAMLIVKVIIAAFACRLFSGERSVAVETAFLLAPAGEFAFVVIAAAATGGVLDAQAATVVAAIAGLSMLVTPLAGRVGRKVGEALAELSAQEALSIADFSSLTGHVVVAGFGRVGRTIARIIDVEGADIVALDRNASLVSRERTKGWKVYLGDAARPEILHQAGAGGAAMFVVTVDDPNDAEAMVRAVRNVRPDAPVLARARDAEHARKLFEAGANFVIPDAVEAGLQLAGRALEEFGCAAETVRDRINAERDSEYRRATVAAAKET